MSDFKAIERNKDIGSNHSLLVKGLVPGIISGQGTEPKKAQGISDVLFTAMTNKHKIPFDFFFNPDDTMKVDIKRESIERIQRCESAIKEAMPVIYEAFNDKPVEKDKVDEVAKAYPFWYVSDMERMKRKYY